MLHERTTVRNAWGESRVLDAIRSAGVGVLLFLVVASSIAGAGGVFFFTMLMAWLLFPVLVGPRNVLDAGYVFMLIALGTVVVVSLARDGLSSLLP